MKQSTAFLNLVLPSYAGTFDLFRPFSFHGTEYPAYGSFWSHNEKFLLTKEMKLWETDNREYIFFIEAETLDETVLAQTDSLLREHVEPELVRGGQKVPPANHMYSYMTVIFMTENPISEAVQEKIRRYSFARTYRFSIRGYSETRLLAVNLSDGQMVFNKESKALLPLYQKVMDKMLASQT